MVRRAPLPVLAGWLAREDEVAVPAVHLAGVRGEPSWLRRVVDDDGASSAARCAAMVALGSIGRRDRRGAHHGRVVDRSGALAASAVEALLALKRARRLAHRGRGGERAFAVPGELRGLVGPGREITSSRADALLPAVDAALDGGASRPRLVALLEGWATRRTLSRLLALAADRRDLEAAYFAILALGRLEEPGAEAVILDRLDDVTDAGVVALARLGGRATAEHVRAALAGGAPPAWLSAGLSLLYRLDPSPEVLALLEARGLLASAWLSAWPAYAGLAETEVLARIADTPGHPVRAAAIAALGRTGGPLAIDALARRLTDADDVVRDEARTALRQLGARLAALGVPLACLEHGASPEAAVVAEAAVRRLRARGVLEDAAVLLLDALAGHDHPHLVRVARPYLRHASPEVRKRAVACLAAAGPSCASWILPSLRDEDPRVGRQALLALGSTGARGLAEPVARWLDSSNMNLKKTAAEALARAGDVTVAPRLVRWLGHHDNPGFRALLTSALRAVAGPYFRSILVHALETAESPRHAALFAEALDGAFSASEIAGLVACRPSLPAALLRRAYAGEGPLRGGDGPTLDAELGQRGLHGRIPRAEDEPDDGDLRPGLVRAEARRRGRRLRALLREAPFTAAPAPALLDLVRAAGDGDRLVVPALQGLEARALATLIAHPDGAVGAGVRRLLSNSTDRLVLARLAGHVELGAQAEPGQEALEARLFLRAQPADARAQGSAPHAELHARALATLRILGEDPAALPTSAEQARFLEDAVDAQRFPDLLRWLRQPSAPNLAGISAAVASRAGAAAAVSFAQRWIDESPRERATAMLDLTFVGAAAHDALEALARSEASLEARARALQALGGRRGERHRKLLRALLDDPHPVLREDAARALLLQGAPEDRTRVVTAWLSGAFREGFTSPLERGDAPRVARAVADATSDPDSRRLFGPLDAIHLEARIPLLLTLMGSPHWRVSSPAKDRLRRLPPDRVLPFVEPSLRAGDLSLLDVLGADGAIPPALLALVRPEDGAVWTRFARRAAGQGLLHAPALAEWLIAWTEDEPSAISVLAQLTDWWDPVRAQTLARSLPGPRRAALVAKIAEALSSQPPAVQGRVLASLAHPTDTTAVRVLAEAEVGAPGVLSTLPPTLRDAVARSLQTSLNGGDEEQTRRLIRYFGERIEHPTEREAFLVRLEGWMTDSSPRIRLHAHRWLRALAPRERYLRATRTLLDDRDPTTVRSAIRALAFGGDAASATEIAEHLFHPSRAVQQAARDGLLALGEHATGPLTRALSRVRPDRRPVIQAILSEVERGMNEGSPQG